MVVRGEIISYSAGQYKLKKRKQEQLMERITELDRKLSVSPSPELDKERQNLQMNYNLMSTQETEKLLLRLHGFLYEHGEKAGHHLARQIKSQSASQLIKQIRTPSGELTVMPSVINETFENFYHEFYTSQSPANNINMINFLDNLEFPSLIPTQVSDMDQPLKLVKL